MAFASFDRKSTPAPMADINMVPLIDVMLVLLVIFIVTAPLLTHAVKLELPRASTQANQLKPDRIDFAIDAAGARCWNGETMSRAHAAERFATEDKRQPQPEVHLRADRDARYAAIVQTLADASKAGLAKVGFVSEPDSQPSCLPLRPSRCRRFEDDRRRRAALRCNGHHTMAWLHLARTALLVTVCWIIGIMAACASTAPTELRFKQPLVLLGEVHDNAAQHALRYRAFAAHVAGGARPALALEQFDREHQAAIELALAGPGAPDADALIAAFGGRGWTWPHYRPFIALALEHKLPIVAANVSRNDARAVMRDGLAAHGFDAAVPPTLMAAHAASIEASHCGQVDAALAGRMALAQVARDQQMARAVTRHAERGVVLLAGNGHVRSDIGVPHWLDAALRARTESIGVIETGQEAAPGGYDRQVSTAPQPRADPCAAMPRAPARP